MEELSYFSFEQEGEHIAPTELKRDLETVGGATHILLLRS